MLSQIVTGQVDLADILLLIAVVLFAVAAFVQRADHPAVLALLGWTLVALALLVR